MWFSIISILFLLSGPSHGCDVLARTEAGLVCGVIEVDTNNNAIASFKGIPYAKQPVGNLRFAELQQLESFNNGYINASAECPVCPQRDLYFGKLFCPKSVSEACICVNINAPIDALPNNGENKTGIPVIVYVHGGGFQSGSGDSDIYGAEYLIPKNCVVVTFNHRLNVFGFLYLNTSSVPGNQGLRDMVTLLKWVQRNIAAFGGDPNDVTLMGQSSGAVCVHMLSLSKATEGLFKRIITLGNIAAPIFYTTPQYQIDNIVTPFLAKLGINSTDPEEIHSQLLTMSLPTILLAYFSIQGTMNLIDFAPVIETPFDGVTTIIDEDISELIRQGQGKDYPQLMGFTNKQYEALRRNIVNAGLFTRVEEDNLALLLPDMLSSASEDTKREYVAEIVDEYFNGNVTLDAYIAYLTDLYAVYPELKYAQFRNAINAAPVFLYQFSYEAECNIVQMGLNVSFNGTGLYEDLPFIFRFNCILGRQCGSGCQTSSSLDSNMINWMTNFIINFINCSHPTCGDDSAWSPASAYPLQYQDISEPGVYRLVEPTDEQINMLQLFDRIYANS